MPGRYRSHAPWSTSNRFPRRPSSASRSGIQGARPSTPATAGSAATPIETAPPIEKPTSSDGRSTTLERGAGVRHARVERVPRLEAVAHLREREVGEPRRELGREQLARRAPRAGHGLRGAAVDEHDRRPRRPRCGGGGRRPSVAAATSSLRRQRLPRARTIAPPRRLPSARFAVAVSLPWRPSSASSSRWSCPPSRPRRRAAPRVRLRRLAEDVVEVVVSGARRARSSPRRRSGRGPASRSTRAHVGPERLDVRPAGRSCRG